MTGDDEEREKRLIAAIKRREREISELIELYREYRTLAGKEFRKEYLDRLINDRFSVTDGLDCLGFESIEKVRVALERAIEELKKRTTGDHGAITKH